MFDDYSRHSSSSPKKEEERRLRDLEFIARLRVAGRRELELLRYRYYHSSYPPAWKVAAVARALEKLNNI